MAVLLGALEVLDEPQPQPPDEVLGPHPSLDEDELPHPHPPDEVVPQVDEEEEVVCEVVEEVVLDVVLPVVLVVLLVVLVVLVVPQVEGKAVVV